MRQEIVDRSGRFEEQTKGSKDEYNIYREHIRYVYKYVNKLSEGKAVDREVLEISALLHDIAMTDMTLDRSRHNEYGAEIAEQLLREKYKSLYSLAHKVMGLNDEESLKFIQDKLTKDYNELSDELKYLVSDIYSDIMKAGSVREIIEA